MFLRQFSKSLENPTFLAGRFQWLYWRIYNFSWENWFPLFENKLAKASPLASAAGYLVYLNDALTEHFDFDVITGSRASVLGIDTREKLILIYFGLIFMAIARFLYLRYRPISIRRGPSQREWTESGLNEFTVGDFVQLHGDIRHGQHRTRYGKYYDDDWDAFLEDARWSESGKTLNNNMMEKIEPGSVRKSREHVHFSDAKLRHEDLLRGILIDRYSEYSAKNKISLLVSVSVMLFGMGLFLLPNLDLFLTIFASTFLEAP